MTKKNSRLQNVILEVSVDVFRILQSNKREFFDWDCYPVYEYVSVLRCFKCWKYGHKAANCRQEHIVCPLCNKNHSSENCTSEVFECTNCKYAHDVLKINDIEINHTVFDKSCISYQRAIERVKNRTKYN